MGALEFYVFIIKFVNNLGKNSPILEGNGGISPLYFQKAEQNVVKFTRLKCSPEKYLSAMI